MRLLLLFSDDEDDDEGVAVLQRVLLHYVNRRKAADRKRAEREFQVGWRLGRLVQPLRWLWLQVSHRTTHYSNQWLSTCSC